MEEKKKKKQSERIGREKGAGHGIWNLPVDRNVNLGVLISCYLLSLPHRSPQEQVLRETTALGLFQSQKKINYKYFLHTFLFGKWP